MSDEPKADQEEPRRMVSGSGKASSAPRTAKDILAERDAEMPAPPPDSDGTQGVQDKHWKYLDGARSVMEPTKIVEEVAKVDVRRAAGEILEWMTSSVDQFIDNKDTIFQMYLTVTAEEDMPNAALIQRLYTSIPTPEDALYTPEGEEAALDALDSKCEEVKAAMVADEDAKRRLFKKMAFYYEMTGFSPTAGPVIQEMEGEVVILDFAFDPVPITVQVRQAVGETQEGEVVEEDDEKVVRESKVVETGKRKVVKQVSMPAGFGIQIEIQIWQKRPRMSLF